MKTYICDPRVNGGAPRETDISADDIQDGFIDVGGERREVREVHRTTSGTQIELYP